MSALFQVLNFQFDVAATFDTRDAAVAHVKELQKTYKERFYVVQLAVVDTVEAPK